MLNSALGRQGAVTAPHHAAAHAGRDVLAEGGSAVEAMIAMAATISVVYPHMVAIGGDGVWLIDRPGAAPTAIMAVGRAARAATLDAYAGGIPTRGPRAALTAPAALAGWRAALALDAAALGPRHLPLDRLLAPAAAEAREGAPVTASEARITAEKFAELSAVPGFCEVFAPDGAAAAARSLRRNTALADTLERLGRVGLDDFYTGDIAAAHARFFETVGAPLTAEDLAGVDAPETAPLTATIDAATLYNSPAPTQGVASLMILGLVDRLRARLGTPDPSSAAHIHAVVEATKPAFRLRDRALGDPDAMAEPAQAWLDPSRLDALAAEIDLSRAAPWPAPAAPGDTVWMAAADASGCLVSYIQSIYWEFGSGLACPETGVHFQNRGAGFSLAPGANQLAPGKRPIHTLNPAIAHLNDGRRLAYGAMGGDGQPQFQAAVFFRALDPDRSLAACVAAPRWLLGRTWGDSATDLKIEADLGAETIAALRGLGHEISVAPALSETMGHAGALAIWPEAVFETATDPRSDGLAAAL